MKTRERNRALLLRKQGKTYKEILTEIPVAKSTLSLWLRSVALSKPQKQRVTQKRKAAALKGAQVRRDRRLKEIQEHTLGAVKKVGRISKREVWFLGVALYWAEGAKQNQRSPSAGVQFGNSDPSMIRIFLAWLDLLSVSREDIYFELYIHKDRKRETLSFRRWWSRELDIPLSQLSRVYYKQGNPSTNRTNTGNLYHGLLRIKVRNSTSLNRKIHAWISVVGRTLGNGVIGNTSAFGAEESRFEP